MNNNPIRYNDPPAIAIAAIIGGIAGAGGNMYAQWKNGNLNSVGDWVSAALIGGVSGAVGGAIASVAILGAGALSVGAANSGMIIAGYQLGSTGAVSGAMMGSISGLVGGALRQVGNVVVGWQDDFNEKELLIETAMGGLLGGVIGGVSAAWKGQNFWWGNSTKILPNGDVVAGLGLKINSKTVSKFAMDQNIYGSQRGKLSSKIIDSYYDKMLNNSFDPALKQNQIGGFLKNGKWIIGEGHHRVAAAIKYGMKTGNYDILTQMMNYGRFVSPNYSVNFFKFPNKWQ